MRSETGFRLGLGVYYLALGTWFGTTLMMGLAAANTFRVTRSLQPTLPPSDLPIDSPPEYLAGQVVNAAFGAMSMVQLGCAGLALVLLVLQCTLWRDRLQRGPRAWPNVLRTALVVVPALVLVADLAYTRQQMSSLRATMYDAAVTSAERASARERFDGFHKLSERSLSLAALMVGAATVVSPLAFGSGRAEPREA